MKRMRIKGFNTEPDETPDAGQDFFAKKAEQAKKIISGRYTPSGSASGREFRTTLELQYEFREIISFSKSAIVDAMNDLGFELDSLDGKPNWVLYPGQTHLIFIVNLQKSCIFPPKTSYGKSN